MHRLGCCCGGGSTPGELCGLVCSDCGGVRVKIGGYVTDANGTWPLSYAAGVGMATGMRCFRPGSSVDVLTNAPFCSLKDDGTYYQYLAGCGTGALGVSLSAWRDCCSVNPGEAPGYRSASLIDQSIIGLVGNWPFAGVSGIVKTCNGDGTITIQFNTPNQTVNCGPFGTPFSLPWPGGSSATMTLFTEEASPQVCCAPCPLPKANLTLTWTNTILGNGSTTLVWTPDSSSWESGCASGFRYSLSCSGGTLKLQVYYYFSGTCPTGQASFCATGQNAPNGLRLGYVVCSPLSLTWTLDETLCPVLAGNGFTGFGVAA